VSPLQPPPDDPSVLQCFPSLDLNSTTSLYRIHRARHGPWFYSSDGTGRFDLPPPNGTCYLADSSICAFIEVFKDTKPVARADVEARRVATLRVSGGIHLADCTQRAARAFGITATTNASADYTLTHPWAQAFHRSGFGGVRYFLSHDPAQQCIGIALFGATGPAVSPVHADEPIGADMITAAREFGILVLPTP
jgi:hypothetical protein